MKYFWYPPMIRKKRELFVFPRFFVETSKYLSYFTTPSYLCNRHKAYMDMSLYRYCTNQLVFSRFIEVEKMEKNMPEREDFEDAIVQPVDGLRTRHTERAHGELVDAIVEWVKSTK
jgi:hypothetical protein